MPSSSPSSACAASPKLLAWSALSAARDSSAAESAGALGWPRNEGTEDDEQEEEPGLPVEGRLWGHLDSELSLSPGRRRGGRCSSGRRCRRAIRRPRRSRRAGPRASGQSVRMISGCPGSVASGRRHGGGRGDPTVDPAPARAPRGGTSLKSHWSQDPLQHQGATRGGRPSDGRVGEAAVGASRRWALWDHRGPSTAAEGPAPDGGALLVVGAAAGAIGGDLVVVGLAAGAAVKRTA